MSTSVLDKIRSLLSEAGIPFKEVEHQPTFTSEEAALARGEELSVGAKAILMKTEETYRGLAFTRQPRPSIEMVAKGGEQSCRTWFREDSAMIELKCKGGNFYCKNIPSDDLDAKFTKSGERSPAHTYWVYPNREGTGEALEATFHELAGNQMLLTEIDAKDSALGLKHKSIPGELLEYVAASTGCSIISSTNIEAEKTFAESEWLSEEAIASCARLVRDGRAEVVYRDGHFPYNLPFDLATFIDYFHHHGVKFRFLPGRPFLPHDDIQLAAYYIWLRNGGGDGHDKEDWAEAEPDLRQQTLKRYLGESADEGGEKKQQSDT